MPPQDDEAYLAKLISSADEEYDRFHSFERELKRNLEEVEDIEKNLKLLKGQMASLKELVGKRQELHERILEAVREPPSESDIRKAKSCLERFDKLGGKVDKLMKRLVDNVEAIHMDEAHELFHEPDDAQRLLRRAADEAEGLHDDIASLRRQLKQQTDGIQFLRDRLNRLVHAEA